MAIVKVPAITPIQPPIPQKTGSIEGKATRTHRKTSLRTETLAFSQKLSNNRFASEEY